MWLSLKVRWCFVVAIRICLQPRKSCSEEPRLMMWILDDWKAKWLGNLTNGVCWIFHSSSCLWIYTLYEEGAAGSGRETAQREAACCRRVACTARAVCWVTQQHFLFCYGAASVLWGILAGEGSVLGWKLGWFVVTLCSTLQAAERLQCNSMSFGSCAEAGFFLQANASVPFLLRLERNPERSFSCLVKNELRPPPAAVPSGAEVL